MGLGLLLDTNVVADFLGSGLPSGTRKLLLTKPLYVSVITHIELLSRKDISPEERRGIDAFLSKCREVFNFIDLETIELAAKIRREQSIKLPDAVIAATAIINELTLVTNDGHFRQVPKLTVINSRMR